MLLIVPCQDGICRSQISNRRIERRLAAREDEQKKLLAQERARTEMLEIQLAVRGDATPDHGRTATASPSDRPASMPPAPGPDKPVTSPLPASDKPVMSANNKSRTLTARPINVVLAVLLVAGGYLVGRLSAPDNDMTPTRSLDRPVGATIVAPAPLSSGAPQPGVSAPPPQEVTSADAPRDAATAPVEMSAAAAATPEVTEPKVIERPSAKAPPLSSGELRELQAWLKVLGFDPGPADGLVGDRTTAAIRYYQRARQLEETGVPDRTLLRQVRKDIGH
jgi:Putative peptidoglycan binding domain